MGACAVSREYGILMKKAPLVIVSMRGCTQMQMTLGCAGAMHANTWKTCRIKMETVAVMVAAILIDDQNMLNDCEAGRLCNDKK